MKLYADTSFLIAIARGIPEALRALTENEGIIVVPAIVYYEFYVGIRKGEMRHNTTFERERALIESLTVEFPDRAVLQRAADIRAKCEAAGIHASDADYIIVAHAVEGAGKIITADEDIERIVSKIGAKIKVIAL